MSEPLQEDLAEASADRPREAVGGEYVFEEVVSRFETPLLRYLGRVLGGGGTEEAEDLVQEAFLRLHRQVTRRGAESIRNMQGWLFQVAHNLAMDAIRKRERRERGKQKAAESGTLEADPPETVDALGEMIHQEACQKALAELDRLPQPQRQAIFLRVIQEMTLREVGEVTGLTVGNAAYRIDQGLKTLARRLKSEGMI